MLSSDKQYVVGVVGDGLVTRKIQAYSPCGIPCKERWAHVAIYFNGCIYESHFKSGVASYKYEDWLAKNCDAKVVEAYEYPFFNIDFLKKSIGQPYGMANVMALDPVVLMGRLWGNCDFPGQYCSELVLNADTTGIAVKLNIKACQSKPVDLQIYGLFEKREFVTLRR